MYCFIDFDETIAMLDTTDFIALCDKRLRLRIPKERLQSLSFEQFLSQPEVLAIRKHGQQRFDRLLDRFYFDQEAFLARRPIEGARAGIIRLTQYSRIGAYILSSVHFASSGERPSSTLANRNQYTKTALNTWLTTYQFPRPEKLLFCDGPGEKLRHIAELVEASSQPAILVSKRAHELLSVPVDQAVEKILQGQLLLGVYGVEQTAVRATRWPIVALPEWFALDSLLEASHLLLQ